MLTSVIQIRNQEVISGRIMASASVDPHSTQAVPVSKQSNELSSKLSMYFH